MIKMSKYYLYCLRQYLNNASTPLFSTFPNFPRHSSNNVVDQWLLEEMGSKQFELYVL